MPKPSKNYSKSVVYTIKHKKLNFVYVGSTTDFDRRKHAHLYACNTPTHPYHDQLLYRIIRTVGGLNDFDFNVHKQVNCSNGEELAIEEQNVINELKPNLNKNRSFRTVEQKNEYIRQYINDHKDKLNDYSKAYYQNNKDRLIELKKEKYQCACGGKCTRSGYLLHCRTDMHKNYLNTFNIEKTKFPEARKTKLVKLML